MIFKKLKICYMQKLDTCQKNILQIESAYNYEIEDFYNKKSNMKASNKQSVKQVYRTSDFTRSIWV